MRYVKNQQVENTYIFNITLGQLRNPLILAVPALNEYLRDVYVGMNPFGVAITPDGRYVYVTNNSTSEHSVKVIDTATNTLVGYPIWVGSLPLGVAITPDGKRVYVTNIGSNTVSVIDTATNTLMENYIPVGNYPAGVAITPFAPPIANAGTDQTARVGAMVTLDGSTSNDPSGNSLTYAWSFVSKPAGSKATLPDTSIVNPTFTPDVVGDYVIQLVVTDAAGLTSQPAKVTVSTLNSPPVANAGLDQAIAVIGTVVHLNGSQSYDPDGQPITYQWSISSEPAGSHATLDVPTAVKPSFVANVHGDYSIQLIVTDSLGTASDPAIVKVSFNNVAPVASAGLSQSAIVGQIVTLNGSGSIDTNGDPLTYKWSVISAPSGSQAVISDSTAQTPAFVPDIPGTFVVQLIVNDGFVDSLPATVQIEAISMQTKVTRDIHSSQQVIASIAPSTFKNATMQNAVLNKLNAVIASIEAGNYSNALGQLQNDILDKTNGCATSKVPAPDKNDWILSCAAQNSVYQLLLNIIAEVKALGQ